MILEILGVTGLAIVTIIILVTLLPMCFMRPLPSGQIKGTDIIAIKNRINNLFFILSGNEYIVIDAGSDVRAVMREMDRILIDRHKVTSIFLTHTDYDHVASIPLFPNAAIYMSKQEKQMIDGSTYRQFLKKNKLPRQSVSNRIIWITDHETIELNDHKVRMIEAPGHTKGSAMYVVDEKYLFSGDVFRVVNGKLLVHPYSMDKLQAKRTIQNAKNELKQYEKVFTAHYGLL